MQLINSWIPYKTTYSLSPNQIKSVRELCGVFTDESDNKFDYTDTQLLIIATIMGRIYPRVQLILPTQYGKSEAVSQGVLLRASRRKEKWAIVAPSKEKAQIIMGYIIKHIFDHPMFEDRIVYDEPKEKLRQHKSKEYITFKKAGEVRIFTADAKNRQNVKKALMGFGAPNLIIDESGLIDDDLYATAKRMVGGKKDNFILEIGNPFSRSHFLRTWQSERYQKVWVDYNIALREGRYSPEFIQEMEEEAFFDILYGCKFPDEEEILQGGYRPLIIPSLLENSFIQEPLPIPEKEIPILGVDVADGGKNKTVFVIRFTKANFAMVLEKNGDNDLGNQKDRVINYMKRYNVEQMNVCVDDTGVGSGLTDILKEHNILVTPVVLGGSSDDPMKLNKRAENYWSVRKWLKTDDGKIVYDDGFKELLAVNYKNSRIGSKVQIEAKEDLKKRGVQSPDTADALMLTFSAKKDIIGEDDFEFV